MTTKLFSVKYCVSVLYSMILQNSCNFFYFLFGGFKYSLHLCIVGMRQ